MDGPALEPYDPLTDELLCQCEEPEWLPSFDRYECGRCGRCIEPKEEPDA